MLTDTNGLFFKLYYVHCPWYSLSAAALQVSREGGLTVVSVRHYENSVFAGLMCSTEEEEASAWKKKKIFFIFFTCLFSFTILQDLFSFINHFI